MNIFVSQLEELWKKYKRGFENFFYGLGYGNTPLQKLPPELNPYGNIYIKREDLEPEVENIKIRAIAGIYYLHDVRGELKGKTTVTVTSSGNFAKTLPKFLKKVGSNLKIRYFILKDLIDANPKLLEELEGDVVVVPESGYCPLSKRAKGRPITNAKLEAEIHEDFIYFDQHDGIGNPFGNLTLGEETSELGEAVIVQGLGTCGSTLGHYYGRVFSGAETKLVALLPEDGRQVGLRNRSEQGESENFREVTRIADKIIEISNKEAYETMIKLWENGIPGGISSGTNVAGALKITEKTEEDIITLVPDSLVNYEYFLQRKMKEVLGKDFEEYSEIFKKYKNRGKII